MKLLSFLCFIGLSIITVSCTDEKKETINAAKAAADSTNYTTVQWLDSIVSFGAINMGEKIEVKFRCKNTGDKPLIITNAKPGCGCTVADYTKEPIAPGKEGVVTAAFDSKKAHGGTVEKSIIVTTNTSNGTEHYLKFTGEVNGAPSNDKIVVPHAVPSEKKS
ncbi:MAG: DUF1573 domain-containing protein [Chitinophagaceae bacterium]